ncbi:flavin reductase family protein [Mesobacterium pallidum]|uniref:flavin reductase family protein n=1 Tax=Mesobacterium pallidum TaxID=2872037 RepID=UPI001EE17A57|nr:flavin reductase family protein [Mesobacterium pallidum]
MIRLDPRALRQALGRLPTGVTVVTTRAADGAPLGFTANSFSSVSLDPPMLLVCPGRRLSSFDAFVICRHFAVSALAGDQEDLSIHFATCPGDRFAGVAHRTDLNGVPILSGAAATFSCQTAQAIPAGDHCVLIGKIMDMTDGRMPALGFAHGRYFQSNALPGRI